LLVYAKALEGEKRYDAAEAIVQRALAVDPARADAYVILGSSALGRKADDSALLAFEKALVFDPRSKSAVNGLLEVFAHGKPNASAIAKIERMAAAPPQSATLFEVAGRLYSMIGHTQDAEAALKKALAVDEQRPTAALALWQVERHPEQKIAANDSTENDAQLRAYELQVKQGDPSGVAANNLAYAYATRGKRLDRALDLAVESVHRIPSRPEPMDTLGFVLLKMRQYSAAAEAFERALALKPDAGTRRHIELHLADAYEASGLTAKAAELRQAAAKAGG
jgi:tetratricopeptide (TPR) repeat protein